MNKPLRIAVVGVGAFGALHARTLRAFPGVVLTALGGRTKTRAGPLARELGVSEVFCSVDELIGRKLADALIIATHADTHVSFAKAALTWGLHVLVEKPVGRTLAEVKDLAQYAQDNRAMAMAGHICMFHSQISPLVARVRQVGFRSAHFVRHRPATLVDLFPEEHPITLTMVHDLYVAAQMANGAEPVCFDALETCRADGRVDHTWATLRWSDHRVATFHSHWILPAGSPDDGFDATEIFAPAFHTKVCTNPQNWIWTGEKASWPLALEISEVNGAPTGMLAEEKRRFDLIFPKDIMNGDGVRSGLHSGRIESVQLLHIGEDLLQLVPESHLFILRQLKAS